MRKKLSERQLEIMNIFWQMNKSLIASEIVTMKEDLNINTVQAAIRSLIKKDYIAIDEIVYSGTVLTRSYKAIVSKEEYLGDMYKEIQQLSNSEVLLATLINQEEDTKILDELERMIERKRNQLER